MDESVVRRAGVCTPRANRTAVRTSAGVGRLQCLLPGSRLPSTSTTLCGRRCVGCEPPGSRSRVGQLPHATATTFLFYFLMGPPGLVASFSWGLLSSSVAPTVALAKTYTKEGAGTGWSVAVCPHGPHRQQLLACVVCLLRLARAGGSRPSHLGYSFICRTMALVVGIRGKRLAASKEAPARKKCVTNICVLPQDGMFEKLHVPRTGVGAHLAPLTLPGRGPRVSKVDVAPSRHTRAFRVLYCRLEPAADAGPRAAAVLDRGRLEVVPLNSECGGGGGSCCSRSPGRRRRPRCSWWQPGFPG